MNSAPWDDPRIARGMAIQLQRRRERLDAGEKAVGWKVAFGAAAAMERLRITAPLFGFLMQRGVLASGATVSVAGWANPVLEPEIAVHICKDVPAGADREVAAAAIGGVGPAIEILDPDRQPTAETLEETLADDIFQRNIVIGKNDTSRAGCVLSWLGRAHRKKWRRGCAARRARSHRSRAHRYRAPSRWNARSIWRDPSRRPTYHHRFYRDADAHARGRRPAL